MTPAAPVNVPTRPARAGRDGYAKSAQTRGAILAAALAEASEHGLYRASVARIAARAGTAIGSVNYHFGSRRELMQEVMRQLIDELGGRLAAAEAAVSTGFFARLRAELLAYLEYLRAHPAHIRLADEIKLLEPQLYAQGLAEWAHHLCELLRSGVDDGSLHVMDERELTTHAHFLLGARHFLESLQFPRDPSTDAAAVDAYVTLAREGMGRRSL